MTALHDKLARAVTDDEAKDALLDAIREVWPGTLSPAPAWEADCLIRGPSAGWIGIGVLMMQGAFPFSLQWQEDGAGTALTGRNSKLPGRDTLRRTDAKRPDCAIVLAALKARAEPIR